MKVLITGGMGFVGRHFARHYLDHGADVTIVDNMSTGTPFYAWMFQPKRKPEFIRSDARTYFRHYQASQFDLVIHCAANVGGRLNIENDPLAVATNLSVDSEFFNWVVRHEPKPRVVYFSSSAVYPLELQTAATNCALSEALVTFDTNRIGMPDMTYGFAKLAGEYLAQFAVKHYGLDVKIYRPFGGYGEDQSPDYPFPAIVRRVVDGDDPIVVWGSGNQRRDFIHIDDIVAAVTTTLDLLHPGETLNLGNGVGISFYELAHCARQMLGTRGSIKNDSSKPEGVYARVADTYKLDRLCLRLITLDRGIKRMATAMIDKLKKAV